MGIENLVDIRDKRNTCCLCKYSTLYTGSGPNKYQKPEDIGCYYAGYKQHTRRLENGSPLYPWYKCDKFTPKDENTAQEKIERNKITIGKAKRGSINEQT